ncbi:MAG: ABC transporter ATP-binding protein [Treponema sp.]|nr:ABC transporter ATP-binding protein [Treponema sp.]
MGIRSGGKLFSSVEDISFDIRPGEILGILGESGSGKTLTALSIPGLLAENKVITGGEIFFTGKNLLTTAEKEMEAIRGREISMVFQEPFSSLNPLLKIGEQIAETAELHSVGLHSESDLSIKKILPRSTRSFTEKKNKSLIKDQVMELMDKLNLPEPEKLMEAYPHRLSGGMCQRVMIALSTMSKPRLLIADEPTTALDHNTQSQIIDFLKEINLDFGTSILIISHDLEVVKNICSRVLVMYSGRILEEGKTEEVFSNPSHEYTKGLLASIPDKTNKGKVLAAIPGRIPSLEEGRPSGCPFHPRCKKAGPDCKGEFPAKRSVSATHTSCCRYHE